MVKNQDKVPGTRLGLALGGGAARGLAHIGVLEVLEKEGIHIGMIAGTSLGALIGALYAQGKEIDDMKRQAAELGAKRYSILIDPGLPKTGLIRGRKIENTIKSIIGDIDFKDLKVPFACVATDIGSGEEVVIDRGLVWKGVRASGSLPILFNAARWEDRYLVDGGLVNPVPVSVLKTMGADFIIAVNVIANRGVRETNAPNIFRVAMQSFHIYSYGLIKSCLTGSDVVIEPQMGHLGFTDFHKSEEFISQGRQAAEEAIPEIKRRYPAV